MSRHVRHVAPPTDMSRHVRHVAPPTDMSRHVRLVSQGEKVRDVVLI